jgi:hypothetical protein
MKKIKRIIIGVFLMITIIAIAIKLWTEFGIEKSNPNNYATIGEIPTPTGYDRIDGDDPRFSELETTRKELEKINGELKELDAKIRKVKAIKVK